MRTLKNAFYRAIHSSLTLGGVGAAVFVCALLISFDYRGSTTSMLLHDPRPATFCAIATVATVMVYDGENRIPSASAMRGNSRMAFYLSRAAVCYLLTTIAYIVTVVSTSVWIKSPMTVDFIMKLLTTLPCCIGSTALLLLIAAIFRSMIAYIAVTVLLLFVVWMGLGAELEWLHTVFPPYMQMSVASTAQNYILCGVWVTSSLILCVLLELHVEMS